MHLCLLQCDHVDEKFRAGNGDYDSMFRRLFANTGEIDACEIDVFDVTRGEFPDVSNSSERYDGYLTTGSRRSVSEDLDWVHGLEALVRSLYQSGQKFVGICFGHQMIAQALGGKVDKAKQWSVGIHEFETLESRHWMQPPLERFSLLMSCQDQVSSLPPGSHILASSALCPAGVFQLGEHFLGIQGHPEFEAPYAEALMKARRGSVIESTIVDTGLRSLSNHQHGRELGRWLLRFFETG